MFRTVSLSTIGSLALYTQQQVQVTQVVLTACQQAVSITCMTYLLLCAQCQTPDDGQRYCPKHVQPYSKYKFRNQQAVSITCMTYLLLCVQCQTPDDGQRYCPKHVESYSKYKFRNQQAVSITCMTYTYRCVHSARLLMVDRDTVLNMWSPTPKINLRNQCFSLVLL